MLIGVAAFVHLRDKSDSAGQTLDGEEIAGFGLCESCGQALASSGPLEVQQDEDGDFVVCGNCSHKNRARYEDGEDQGGDLSGRDKERSVAYGIVM